MNTIGRKNITDLAILVAITLAIGIYLIATTVVISKDGVTYIERAQKLPTHYSKVLNLNEPIGMPAIILAFHRLLRADDVPESWILSGQIGVLTCRMLTIVVLYFFGLALFDRRQSFWAVFILIFLPYPAQIGADVLREWPHLLFLFTSLLFFYTGIQKASGIYLFGAGLMCGLGYIIRPECAQVLLYGLVFFLHRVFSCFRQKLPLRKNWIYLCLIAGFLAVFVPYTTHLDKRIPEKLDRLYLQINPAAALNASGTPVPLDSIETAAFQTNNLFYATGNLLMELSKNLMYYFALPAGIGFYLLVFKSTRKPEERHWLVGLFMGFYIAILCLLYLEWGYISHRHTLPMAVMLCFYIPYGIEQIGQRLNRKQQPTDANLRKWAVILTSIGFLICLPKLGRPLGYGKKEYRQAACWIAENTNRNALFYSFENRIPFYAGRTYRIYKNPKKFKSGFKADYLITESKNGQIEIPVPTNLELQKTFPLSSTGREVLIYNRTP